jgi:hypothetical protein
MSAAPGRSPVSSTIEDSLPAWVKKLSMDAEEDKRSQPWKETFGDKVDRDLDNEPELVRVEDKSTAHAFHVLHQSMAG